MKYPQTQYTRKWRKKLTDHERWRLKLQGEDATLKERKEFIFHDCKSYKCGE